MTTFGRRDEVLERFERENDVLYESSRSAQFASSLMQPIMGLVGNLQFVTTAVVGGLGIANGTISLGAVQAMLQYVRQFGQPLQQLASTSATFQSGLASLERVVELLDQDEITPDPAGPHEPAPVRGRVAFEDVSFSYDPTAPLIEGLTLTAEPGETVAIVGPTGAGKTTLVNLLLRFYELDAGRITLDGRDIASMPRRELRSRSAWCCRTPGSSGARSSTTSATAIRGRPTTTCSTRPVSRTSTGWSIRCPTATRP